MEADHRVRKGQDQVQEVLTRRRFEYKVKEYLEQEFQITKRI